MTETPTCSADALLRLIQNRRSGRYYDSFKDVEKNQLDKIIEAGRWAASCFGEEPWRYIICDKKIHPEIYQKVFKTLAESNQTWAKNAPILITVIAAKFFKKNGSANRWGPYDTGASAKLMMLEATSLGLMAHQMGGFDEKALKSGFNIDENYEVMSVMALGYEAEESLDKEAPHTRKPIETRFFFGKWQN